MKKGLKVKHQVFSERGQFLLAACFANDKSNIRYGQEVDLGDGTKAAIGDKCTKCHKKIRGVNHAEGSHHRGY